MVNPTSCDGIIVSTGRQSTAALDELLAHCDWPAILNARPRRLREELDRWQPDCVLFWLQQRDDVAATVALVRWAREQAPRPYRVALAYRLPSRLEPALRSAGIHAYLPVSDEVGAIVQQAVWPLLDRRCAQRNKAAPLPVGQDGADREPLNVGTFPELGRPP